MPGPFKIFLFFLLFLPTAEAIAVWPESVSADTDSIFIYNNAGREMNYRIVAENVDVSRKQFRLNASQLQRVSLEIGLMPKLMIEEFADEKQNVVNIIEIPVFGIIEEKGFPWPYLLLLLPLLVILAWLFKKSLNKIKSS